MRLFEIKRNINEVETQTVWFTAVQILDEQGEKFERLKHFPQRARGQRDVIYVNYLPDNVRVLYSDYHSSIPPGAAKEILSGVGYEQFVPEKGLVKYMVPEEVSNFQQTLADKLQELDMGKNFGLYVNLQDLLKVAKEATSRGHGIVISSTDIRYDDSVDSL